MLISRQFPAGPLGGGPVVELHPMSPRVSPYIFWLCPAGTVNVFVPFSVVILNQHCGLVPISQLNTALQSRPGRFSSAEAGAGTRHACNSASAEALQRVGNRDNNRGKLSIPDSYDNYDRAKAHSIAYNPRPTKAGRLDGAPPRLMPLTGPCGHDFAAAVAAFLNHAPLIRFDEKAIGGKPGQPPFHSLRPDKWR
jgi:hypothetical protein